MDEMKMLDESQKIQILEFAIINHNGNYTDIAKAFGIDPPIVRSILRKQNLEDRLSRYNELVQNKDLVHKAIFSGVQTKIAPGFQVAVDLVKLNVSKYRYRKGKRIRKPAKIYLFILVDSFTETVFIVPLRSRFQRKTLIFGLYYFMYLLNIKRIFYINHPENSLLSNSYFERIMVHTNTIRVPRFNPSFDPIVSMVKNELENINEPTLPMNILGKISENLSGKPPNYVKVDLPTITKLTPEHNANEFLYAYRGKNGLRSLYNHEKQKDSLDKIRYGGIFTTNVFEQYALPKKHILRKEVFVVRNLSIDQVLKLDRGMPLEIKIENARFPILNWSDGIVNLLIYISIEHPSCHKIISQRGEGFQNIDEEFFNNMNDKDIIENLQWIQDLLSSNFKIKIYATYSR